MVHVGTRWHGSTPKCFLLSVKSNNKHVFSVYSWRQNESLPARRKRLKFSVQSLLQCIIFFEYHQLTMAVISPVAVAWAALVFALYQTALVIYRLYFHPLARFPGPKIAASTHWWECIQDLFAGQGGDYMNQVEQMHDRYGGCSDPTAWFMTSKSSYDCIPQVQLCVSLQTRFT